MHKVTAENEKRIFALLRAGLGIETIDESLFDGVLPEQWSQLYEIAIEQGVLGFAYDGAMQLPSHLQPDIDNKVQWAFNIEHIEKLYKNRLSNAQRLTKLYADNAIRMMIMKGLTLAANYPTPSRREFGDIDIYLFGDYERGNEIIAAKGVAIKYDFFVHSEFMLGTTNVENHRYFVNPDVNGYAKRTQQILESLVAGATPHTTVEGAYMPSADFDFLFLLRHSSWHFARESIRLRDICDWAMFLRNRGDKIDKTVARENLAATGLGRYAAILNALVSKYLHTTPPFDVVEVDMATVERVKEDIFTFDNPEKHNNVSFLRAFFWKIRNRIERQWCYGNIVPDSYFGNVGYSILNYIKHPLAIFKAKI